MGVSQGHGRGRSRAVAGVTERWGTVTHQRDPGVSSADPNPVSLLSPPPPPLTNTETAHSGGICRAGEAKQCGRRGGGGRVE